MSGFEHQVASHMMAEGMTDEALALTRMIHDRYHAAKRNPYNEIECSDHYARAMASYGTYITACGFTCHGPLCSIGFDPKMGAADFKAAFTTATGWGMYEQQQNGHSFRSNFTLVYGTLDLQNIQLVKHAAHQPRKLSVMFNGKPVQATMMLEKDQVHIQLAQIVRFSSHSVLTIQLV